MKGPEVLLEQGPQLGGHVRHAGEECGHQPRVEGQQVRPGAVDSEERLHQPPPVHLGVVVHAELGRRRVQHLSVHTVRQLS